MSVRAWQLGFGLLSISWFACTPPAPPASSSPQDGLRVEAGDPPQGARLVGPIEGNDGPDCALLDARGTEAGARADLKKAAAQRGIDFVKVTQITAPYSDHICVHKRYRIQGIGYALLPAPLPAPAPQLAASATPTATPATSVASPAPSPACDPPCATGYDCHAGSCEATCDPPCGPGKFCRFDRVCAPKLPKGS